MTAWHNYGHLDAHVPIGEDTPGTIVRCACSLINLVHWGQCSSSSPTITGFSFTIEMTFKGLPTLDAGLDSEAPSKKENRWKTR